MFWLVNRKILILNDYKNFVFSHHVLSQNVVWLVLDSCVDFIFIADVFINFLTTIVAENGETVDDRNIIQVTATKVVLVTSLSVMIHNAVRLKIKQFNCYSCVHNFEQRILDLNPKGTLKFSGVKLRQLWWLVTDVYHLQQSSPTSM